MLVLSAGMARWLSVFVFSWYDYSSHLENVFTTTTREHLWELKVAGETTQWAFLDEANSYYPALKKIDPCLAEKKMFYSVG